MFVLAGLPDIIEKLSTSHHSSIRILRQLKIKELNVEDRIAVIDKAINSDGQKQITSEARNIISTLSEGYPQFIQQFGFSAFEYNSDGKINKSDVYTSAFMSGGALDAIGTESYNLMYNTQVQSDEYRQVLSIMANKSMSGSSHEWIKKNDINNDFDGNEDTVTNALKTLTFRKIILKNPSKRGEYKLQQRGFALWIKLFGKRQ